MARATRAKETDLPSYETSAYRRWKPEWQLLDDFFGGTKTVWERAQTYLPRHEGEEVRDWKTRVRASEVFNGVKRTVTGLNGIQWRTPARFVTTDDNDEPIKLNDELRAHADDIDGKGNAWTVWAAKWSARGWLKGVVGGLVDYPVTQGPDGEQQLRSAREEEENNIRPYWVGYEAEDIMGGTLEREGARLVLTSLTLRNRLMERNGRFGEHEVFEYLEYTREGRDADNKPVIMLQMWKEDDKGKPQMHGGPTRIMGPDYIPFVLFPHGVEVGPFEVEPPVLDIAYLNLAHFRVKSDRRYSLKMTLAPILVLKGLQDDAKIVISSNAAIKIPDPTGKAYYVEPSGSGLSAARDELNDLKAEMAALGVGLLMRETSQAETEGSKRIDREERMSAVGMVAQAWQDGLAQMWEYHCQYLGIDAKDAPKVVTETDFSYLQITPEYVQLIREIVAEGNLSLETLWDVLLRAGILGPDFDIEREIARIVKMVERELDKGGQVQPGQQPPPPGEQGSPGTDPAKPGQQGTAPPTGDELPAPPPAPPQ